MKSIIALFLCVFLFFPQILFASDEQSNRVIILSDIEADPDDTQSFVRLFLYSNVIDLKGLIATTSCWQKSQVNPGSIKNIIEAYGKVRTNLLEHEAGFPSTEALLSLVKEGLPVYGMLGVGKGKNSEGSELIVRILEEDDSRPLWISVWGGANTLAQALYIIENTKTKKEAQRLINKLRVYAISDQDDSGVWIRTNYPDLFYIVSPGDHYGSATWTAINSFVNGIDNQVISNTWIANNIQQNHGALGTIYPDVAWGVEGDTPAFLSLIPNGLNAPEHPEWGGWGGRYEYYKPDFSAQKRGNSGVPFVPETRKIWTDAVDSFKPFLPNEYGRAVKMDTLTISNNKVSLWRWRDDFQNDFSARMDWCTKSYAEANHPPVPVLNCTEEISVKSGESVSLSAIGSTDPDGDHISFLWFSYPEAGSYEEPIVKVVENLYKFWFVAPKVKQKETAHIILKVTDKGSPQLSRYKRVIVNILP